MERREYITENDVDDVFKWGCIAKKLNCSERACKSKMRNILDCGIYGEEKVGELIVFLYYFNFTINRLICGVLFALEDLPGYTSLLYHLSNWPILIVENTCVSMLIIFMSLVKCS